MKRLVPLLLLACAPKPVALPSPTPTPAPAPAPAFDLSGDWTAGEPRVTRPCGKTVTHWRVYHDGERIGMSLVLGTALRGLPNDLPIGETVWGTVKGRTLALESVQGTSAPSVTKWELRYEEDRLHGTRGGEPIVLTRLTVDEPAGCKEAERHLLNPTGAWLIQSGTAEPPMTQLREFRNCAHHPATWSLYVRDGRIEVWDWPATFDQGIATDKPDVVRGPHATGVMTGADIVLDGDAKYRLRYDPESGHLRGTKNGVAVWAVRRSFYTDGPCPGIP